MKARRLIQSCIFFHTVRYRFFHKIGGYLGFWVLKQFFKLWPISYSNKMHFRPSSYHNADFDLVFTSEWTARHSSSWLKRKSSEFWPKKKPL
ncbi:unnamed protein product [Lactuca virosa]|uniref:Uncharacterized protein n=1 Tax=Lactuca virosa TaxID=75947 RepID=A0AAU9MG17_9ASTR|nr:unnamed protein product [Lactuca virosa]